MAEYQRGATRGARRLSRARAAAPLLVGGSGLYVRAVLDGLEFPPTDPGVRARLEAELAAVGAAALHARLAELDPAAAAAILPSNGRRIVRALEVIELTGGPFRATLPEARYALPAVQVGLDVPADVLDERIAARVDRMWRGGLRRRGRARSTAARPARGPDGGARARLRAGAARMLDGELTEDEARGETVAATRRFARRQESWFRRDRRVAWLRTTPPTSLDAGASRRCADRTSGPVTRP